ncbi:MAG: hypothetical protein V1822_00155 [Candidatus Micrarchaeota archaeon]
MQKLVLALWVLLLFAGSEIAIISGAYTDYQYLTDYLLPAKPAAYPLNCTFFYRDTNTCSILEKVSNESRESVLLGIIRRLYPDENQDWVRFWNSRLPIADYYDNATFGGLNISDGDYYSNNSLKNTWIRLLNIYPSAYSEEGKFYYVPNQALILGASNVDFVVPNPQNEKWCKQEYGIDGYKVSQKSSIGSYATEGQIVQFSNELAEGQQKNLTYSLEVNASYAQKLWRWENTTDCEGANCTITQSCVLNISNFTKDSVNLSVSLPVKRYSDAFSYSNGMAVPSKGFARGVVDLQLPKDFLYYQITVKGQSFTLRKNDLKIVERGDIYPVLQLDLIPSPSRGGTLHVTSLVEDDDGSIYHAKLRYKLYIDDPNISESDCQFYMETPFGSRQVEDACTTARSIASLSLKVENVSGAQALVIANITDQLSNPIEGLDVQFMVEGKPLTKQTDAFGSAAISVSQRESAQTVVVNVVGSDEYAQAEQTVFVPGKGSGGDNGGEIGSLVAGALPIFLIVIIVSSLVMFLMRRRSGSAWALAPLLLFAALVAMPHAQATDTVSGLDVQATLDACKNYDFDNAVRHLGECSESYRIATEFSSMRRTASVLVANIAPLVVANPDITPYKTTYSNMVLIALTLFRVAWAFNSLYLILNIFNPSKRSKALHQYVWLIVFVIFSYASFSIIQDSISAVNSVSTWIAGTDASSTLSQATLSTEFVVENYEMLKLVLPFLNLSYLILLARYITVIGMILFFPFTLLLFFTSATRGFGKAALTVTFAAMGLGILNAILLLIYNILVQTQDPALAGSFASTFFSASFIVFFGFVNLLVLSIAFLSGIVFIGGAGKGDD